jgi:hypothetical protein
MCNDYLEVVFLRCYKAFLPPITLILRHVREGYAQLNVEGLRADHVLFPPSYHAPFHNQCAPSSLQHCSVREE